MSISNTNDALVGVIKHGPSGHDSIEVYRTSGSIINTITLGRKIVSLDNAGSNTATVVCESGARRIMETYNLKTGNRISSQQL